MKTSSLWIIRVALTVQLIGVLAVPVALAAAQSPRAMWMAEWLRSRAVERTIGVLSLRDGRLSFTEAAGHAEWSIDVASVKRVSNNSRTMTIESSSGEIYVMTIMDSNLMPGSPKKVVAMIESAGSR
jgi:hypothetical protein